MKTQTNFFLNLLHHAEQIIKGIFVMTAVMIITGARLISLFQWANRSNRIKALTPVSMDTSRLPLFITSTFALEGISNIPGVMSASTPAPSTPPGSNPTTVSTQFPAVLSLANLSSQTGFNLTGVSANDYSGTSVSSAGDVNADGINDLIIGAYNAYGNTGVSYVVFGKSGIGSLSLANLNGTNGFKIIGSAGDASGYSVSSAGDVNADGVDDLIIGAPNGNSYSGASYVVFGKPGIGPLSLANLNGTNGFKITGVSGYDRTGYSVSSAGDVNADGINDLIIGAHGANGGAGVSYVVFGRSGIGGTGTLSASALSGSNGFMIGGVSGGDNTGYSVSSAGDVNGDGISDLIVGAYGANSGAGVSYLVFGRSGISAPSLAALNGINGFKITGVSAGDNSGYSVSSAGDVNADGINDLIVGAYNANNAAGTSYVVFGRSGIGGTGTLSLAALNGTNGFKITGVLAGDNSGVSVSSVGDVNADGIYDLIIGAYGANSGSGATYVVFGRSGIGGTGTLSLADLNGTNGFKITGSSGERSGLSVSSVGDVNADGINDLIIGAPNSNSGAGASYVVFGRRVAFFTTPTETTTQSTTAASPVRTGTESNVISLSRLRSASSSRTLSRLSLSLTRSISSTLVISLSRLRSASSSRTLSRLSLLLTRSISSTFNITASTNVSSSHTGGRSLSATALTQKGASATLKTGSFSMQSSGSMRFTGSISKPRSASIRVSHSSSLRYSFSHTRSHSFSHEAIRSKTAVDIPNPQYPLSPKVPTVVTKTAIVVTSVSGFLFPSYANTVTNALRLADYCANADNVGGSLNPLLYFFYSPIALGTDDSDAANINGAIFYTSGFLGITFAAFLVTGHLRNHAEPGFINKFSATAHLILSEVLPLGVSYYIPSIFELSTLSLAHFSSGNKVLSATALAGLGGVFGWIASQVYQKESKDALSKFLLLPFYGPARDFARKPIRFLVLTDMGEACLLAILSGLRPNPQSCGAVAWSMLALSMSYLTYLGIYRPYHSKVDQALVSLNVMFQIVFSALNIAILHDEKYLTKLESVELAMLCYSYGQMAMLISKELMKVYNKRKEAQKNTNTGCHFITPPLPELEPALVLPVLSEASHSSSLASADNFFTSPEVAHDQVAINLADDFESTPGIEEDNDAVVISPQLSQQPPHKCEETVQQEGATLQDNFGAQGALITIFDESSVDSDEPTPEVNPLSVTETWSAMVLGLEPTYTLEHHTREPSAPLLSHESSGSSADGGAKPQHRCSSSLLSVKLRGINALFPNQEEPMLSDIQRAANCNMDLL